MGDEIVAVKKIHIGGSLVDNQYEPTTKEEGENEIKILKLVNGHKNTCNLIETYFDTELGTNSGYILCIVMEYMAFTLKDRMDFYAEKGQIVPVHLIKIYLFQLTKAVNYMHLKKVVHRDIKPENVLVDAATNRIQLCDFGCSIVLEKESEFDEGDGNETYVMSRYYRAPECILGNRFYGTEADLWSLGVVFGELFLGTILFMGSSNMDQMREIILKLGWPTEDELKEMNPSIDTFDAIDGVYGVDKNEKGESWNMIFCGVFEMEESAIEIISELLVYSPEDRLSALEALQHEYFDDVKNLINKSKKNITKKGKKNKKIKKENVIPLDLLKWTEDEIEFATKKKKELRS